MAKLVVVQGVGEGPPLFALDGQEIVLGRQPDVDLRLDAREVSRRHARITQAGKQYYLEDLGSSNGTWLNGNRLVAYKPHPLQNGDVIRLSQLLLFVSFRDELEMA